MAIYDNNPYAQNAGLRDRVLAELERWCVAHKLRVLGRGAAGDAEYPGYTRTLLIDARNEKTQHAVGKQWEAILGRLEPRLRLRVIKGGK